MSWHRLLFNGGGLVAAFLLLTSPVLAGDRVHSSNHTSYTAPAATTVARTPSQAVSISIVVTPPASPANDPLSVRLRGPEGQVRRFPVEGGRAAIQFDRTVIVRPGHSVTIRWVAAK